MKCSNCGKEIANDSNFCEYCGKRIFEKRSYKFLCFFLVLLVSIALAVCGLLLMHEKAVPKVNTYAPAERHEDPDQVVTVPVTPPQTLPAQALSIPEETTPAPAPAAPAALVPAAEPTEAPPAPTPTPAGPPEL